MPYVALLIKCMEHQRRGISENFIIQEEMTKKPAD